jgi:hypothetical protein
MVQKNPNFSGNKYYIFLILIFYWKRVDHNIYEIWGVLKLLKGIFGGNLCTPNVQRVEVR